MPDSFTSKEPYLAALKESNKEKLLDLVYAAEGAIFNRLQQLKDSDHYEERAELKAACEGLLSIQVERLGWPSADRRPNQI